MSPSRFRARATLLIASLALAIGGLLAMPSLPRVVPGPVPITVGDVAVELDGVAEAALPFAASDVTLHWHGQPNAAVTIQFATDPGQFGETIPVHADESGLGGAGPDETGPDESGPDAAAAAGSAADSAESFASVIWSAGARYVRLTSDRPLGEVTVVAFQSDGPGRPVLALDGPVTEAAVSAPSIITRAGWGADESLRFDYAGHEKWPPSYYPLQVFIVHHTDGRNNDPNPEATIRAIYYDDTIIRGWGDMGYNFLIDSAGHIYEGRHARNYASGQLHNEEDLAGNVARGAHAKGYNSGSLGIVLLGTFDTVLPTTAARTSLEKLLAWESGRHGINPTTASTYTNPDLGTSKFLNHISGHRNVNATDCPGSMFYATFPGLRTAVANRIAATVGSVDTTPPTVASLTSMASNPTGGSSIDFGLVFSEPVTGLTAADFTIGGTSSGWSVTGLAGVGSAYTVTASATGPPEGTVELHLAAGSVKDGGNNTGPATPATATATFATDATAPTVGMTFTPRSSATRATSFDVAVTFSERVATLTAADITVGGTSNAATKWSVDPVVGSGANYGFTIENANPADGTLTVAIAAGVTTDPAGNPNEASAVHQTIIDRTAPKAYPPTVRLRSGVSLSLTLPVTVAWSGTDWTAGSGIASYDMARSVDGGSFSVIHTGLTGTSLSTFLTSGHTYRYEVRAHDRAGNVSGWAAGSTFKPSLLQQSSSSIAYHGTWASVSSTSYSGGSDRYATAAGASASLTTSARGLAFVTARGPTRGSVQVYVDGTLKTTINLYAASVQYRYVAYVASWSSVGTHTLRIVVAGTGRVDLDAFEVMR
jgi:hypothetical protein